jgi:hypothetical protein
VAAETLGRLTKVTISDTTVWRLHGEVSQQIEAALEAEEDAVGQIGQRGEAPPSERVPAFDAVDEHVGVSLDGTTVLIREEGYREVKMVSVSEVVVNPSQKVEPPPSLSVEAGVPRPEGVETEAPPPAGAVAGEPSDAGGVLPRPVERVGDEPADSVISAPSTTGEAPRGRQDGLKLKRHSYRAVLGDKAAFSPALGGELARRRVHRAKKITTVNDGSDWIWDLVLTHVPKNRVEVLDWPHGMGHIWKAGEAGLGVETAAGRAWMVEREKELWQGRVDEVQVALKQLPRRRGERGKAIRQVREYVADHAHRMDYARFRAEGRPIGSGTVESGAKNVVAWRMKRGGQSWSRTGATRMLAALGEVHSRRWDDRLAKAA